MTNRNNDRNTFPDLTEALKNYAVDWEKTMEGPNAPKYYSDEWKKAKEHLFAMHPKVARHIKNLHFQLNWNGENQQRD